MFSNIKQKIAIILVKIAVALRRGRGLKFVLLQKLVLALDVALRRGRGFNFVRLNIMEI